MVLIMYIERANIITDDIRRNLLEVEVYIFLKKFLILFMKKVYHILFLI